MRSKMARLEGKMAEIFDGLVHTEKKARKGNKTTLTTSIMALMVVGWYGNSRRPWGTESGPRILESCPDVLA